MSFIKKRRAKVTVKGSLTALDGDANILFSEAAVEGPLEVTCGDITLRIQPSKDRKTLEVDVVSGPTGAAVSVETKKKLSKLVTSVSLTEPSNPASSTKSLPFIKLTL